jgi:hypothetical protein
LLLDCLCGGEIFEGRVDGGGLAVSSRGDTIPPSPLGGPSYRRSLRCSIAKEKALHVPLGPGYGYVHQERAHWHFLTIVVDTDSDQ